MDRIKNAYFRRATSSGSSYSEQTSSYNVTGIDYDLNGNIQHLNRKGVINSSGGVGPMDALTYTYDGNQLTAVSDSANDNYGFIDGNSGTDYDYDTNGNLTSDANKDITSITYNHLNLPTEIGFNNSSSQLIKYTYDATGVKLRKEVPGKTTDYAGNFIYEGGTLQFFSTPEGYVSYDNGQFNYVYNYVDHLGNVRLSYTNIGSQNSLNLQMIEENNYYPFGLKHEGYNTGVSSLGSEVGKKFKYQNQELENSLNYNMHEFELRHYDATIGRFVAIDPNEQFASPYIAMGNSPIISFDPDGGKCYVMNGNEIACPDDDIYDDYRDNDKNGITIMDEVDLDDTPSDNNSNNDSSLDVVFIRESFTPISEMYGWNHFESTVAMNLQGYRVEEGEFGTYHVNASGEVIFGPFLDSSGGIENISGPGNVGKLGKNALKLFKRLLRKGKNGKLPVPTGSTAGQFTRLRGDQGYIHNKTGAIFKKSHSTHGSKTNLQWKAYPKGTTNFSKEQGDRLTIDGDGTLIGN